MLNPFLIMAPTRKEKSSDLKLENIVSIFEEPQNATLLAERRRVRLVTMHANARLHL